MNSNIKLFIAFGKYLIAFNAFLVLSETAAEEEELKAAWKKDIHLNSVLVGEALEAVLDDMIYKIRPSSIPTPAEAILKGIQAQPQGRVQKIFTLVYETAMYTI